jgi:hypothetical protein
MLRHPQEPRSSARDEYSRLIPSTRPDLRSVIATRKRELRATNTSCAATTFERAPVWSSSATKRRPFGQPRCSQRPAVDIGKVHSSDPSEGFIVEQQLVDEFTI